MAPRNPLIPCAAMKTTAGAGATYGIDAPGVVAGLALGAAAAIAASLASAVAGWSTVLVAWFALLAGVLAAEVLLMLRTSLTAKRRFWEQLVSRLELEGSEHALDAGCGRGMIANIVAGHLAEGSVVGVDIWHSKDQSGNGPEVARRNATAEGVADRVRIETADLRDLPFVDDTFDLVASNYVLHNITGDDARRGAVREIVRVLRPGGRIVIVDFRATSTYVDALEAAGARSVSRSGLRWAMFPPVRVVAATL